MRLHTIKANGQTVAWVNSEEPSVMVRFVDEQEHQLRQPPAWAFNEDALEQAAGLGVTTVSLTDLGTGIIWECPLSYFWDDAMSVGISRGYGPQRAVLLKHWRWSEPEQQRPVKVQPTLFDLEAI